MAKEKIDLGPVRVELKYGVPGLLVTSGVALLALSIFTTPLFSLGISLLALGILSYIVREVASAVTDAIEISEERSLEQSELAMLSIYILAFVALAVIVLAIFWPFLPI